MKHGKLIQIAITVVVLGGALAWLAAGSAGDGMVYYKTVDEVLAEADRFVERPVRVNGLLVAGSLARNPDTGQFRFRLGKRGQELEVRYGGILPDSMTEGRELVVEGALQPDRRTFVATEILTKCPSKYEAEARARD